MSKIVILRHGDRYDYENPLVWLWGFTNRKWDTELSYQGIKHTQIVSQELLDKVFTDNKPTHIITSPWIRCMQTATIIQQYFKDCEIIIEPLLGEYEKTLESCTLYPNGRPIEFEETREIEEDTDEKQNTIEGSYIEFIRPEDEKNVTDRSVYISEKLKKKYPKSIWVTHRTVMEKITSYYNLQSLIGNSATCCNNNTVCKSYIGYLSYSVLTENDKTSIHITPPSEGYIDYVCWLNKLWLGKYK
jgi:broad specificity phosphatase PhoE